MGGLLLQNGVQALQVVGRGAERGQARGAAFEDLAQVVELLDGRQGELGDAGAAARVELNEAVARQALQSLADRRAADPQLLGQRRLAHPRSEEHTSELQSLMRISFAVL